MTLLSITGEKYVSTGKAKEEVSVPVLKALAVGHVLKALFIFCVFGLMVSFLFLIHLNYGFSKWLIHVSVVNQYLLNSM